MIDLRGDQNPPREIARLPLPGFLQDLRVVGDMAFVAAGTDGLYIVELSREEALPGPVLRRGGGGLELAWPAGRGLILQHRTDFASGTPWRDVDPADVEVGGEVRARVDASGGSGFYRLRRP